MQGGSEQEHQARLRFQQRQADKEKENFEAIQQMRRESFKKVSLEHECKLTMLFRGLIVIRISFGPGVETRQEKTSWTCQRKSAALFYTTSRTKIAFPKIMLMKCWTTSLVLFGICFRGFPWAALKE